MKIQDIGNVLRQEINGIDFQNGYYGKKTWVLKNGIKQVASLLTETWLEADIRFGVKSAESPKLIFHGFHVDMEKACTNDLLDFEKVSRIHKGGATLANNGIDNRCDKIYYLSQVLEQVFDCRAHCNLYATPRLMAGFKPHSDRHDVFVIQVKGSKKWSFYETENESIPEFGKKHSPEELKLIGETELHEGDVLYVPRGLVHAAKGTEQTSWHLTFGLTGYYWQDALKDIIDQATFKIPQLQRHLSTSSDDTSVFDQQASKLFDQIKEHVSVEKGIKTFQQEFPGVGQQLDEIRISGDSILTDIKGDTNFQLATDLHPSFETQEQGMAIMLPYRRSPLKLNSRATMALAEIQNKKSFNAQNLNGQTDIEENRLLLYYLWENGIIEPVLI